MINPKKYKYLLIVPIIIFLFLYKVVDIFIWDDVPKNGSYSY